MEEGTNLQNPMIPVAAVAQTEAVQLADAAPTGLICPQCHFPVRPEYYFCPNCGANLRTPPLSTTVGTQILIYLFSAALPWIAYLAITKWPGPKYLRSVNPQARAIGWIALAILVASSVAAVWLTTVWINQQISSALSDVGNIGSFGSGL